MYRKGFSLVELVLSIVVIAISLMSVPLLLNQASKSNQYALVQESILAARTKMGNILSFQWDENATDENNSVVRVLDTSNGASALARLTTGDTNRRVGHIVENRRRRMTDTALSASLGQEVPDVFDDIDDFDATESLVAASGAMGVEGEFDYLDSDLNLSVTVAYISDDTNYSKQVIDFDFNVSSRANFDATHSTSIKMVELNATSKNRDFPFLFRIFSSNIGQSKLVERVK